MTPLCTSNMISSSRGIIGREADRRLDQPVNEIKGQITVENVSGLTTFQLRQELKKRGFFGDDHEGTVNFQILLQKMIELLHKDIEERNTKRKEEIDLQLNNAGGKGISIAEQLAHVREKRKAAAIERSKQRQKDEQYFELKRASNHRAAFIIDTENAKNIDRDDEDDAEQESEVSKDQERDPLAINYRRKIGGRYV